MTVVCICWLKLQKLNYNAQDGQCKILVGKENIMLDIEVVIVK